MAGRRSGNSPFKMLMPLAIVCSAWMVGAEPANPTAQATRPTDQQPVAVVTPAPIKKVECVVQGTPTEFPDDIYIKNAGNVLLPMGTKINWSVPNTTRKGTYALSADMAPGTGALAAGVLGGGHPAGAVCACSIAPARLSATQPGSMRPVHRYSFDCTVQGTPTEFPDDVYVVNKGTNAVPKGKVLHWSIPNTNRMGDHTLTEDLGAGKGLLLPAVIPGGMAAGVKCGVTVK